MDENQMIDASLAAGFYNGLCRVNVSSLIGGCGTFKENEWNKFVSWLKVILELEGVRDCPLNVDDEIALGLNMPPILDLEGRGILDQGDSHLELPPFAARVVRAHEIESRSIHTKRWALGISYEYSEEDEDIEDYLIKYVLKLQIINEAAKRV